MSESKAYAAHGDLKRHALRCRVCRFADAHGGRLIQYCREGQRLYAEWARLERAEADTRTTAEAICERDAQEARD